MKNKYLYIGGAKMFIGTAARFYDDELLHVNSVLNTCPRIKPIIIPRPIDGEQVDRTRQFLLNSVNENNAYAKFLLNCGDNCNEIAVSDGFNEIDELLEWVNEQLRANVPDVAVFFDWDRTLSLTEGLLKITPDIMIQYGFTRKDILLYLLGGNARFTRLQNMFTTLREMGGVEIYILTNNAFCGNMENKLLFNLLQILIKNIREEHVLCSRDFPNKGEYLRLNKSNWCNF